MCVDNYGVQVVEGRDKVIDALCAEAEALRAQAAAQDEWAGRAAALLGQEIVKRAAAERNLEKANAQLKQWESGERERVGAHALKADLQKRLAAAEQRAEKAEAQAASPEVMAAIRFLIKLAMYYKTFDGMEYNRREEAADIVEAWLSTLPTPEAQP